MTGLTRSLLRQSALCGLLCIAFQVSAATGIPSQAPVSVIVTPGDIPQGMKAEEWRSIKSQIARNGRVAAPDASTRALAPPKQEAKFAVEGDGSLDRFAAQVRIDGNTLLISDYQEPEGSGAVYVFERGANGWTRTARLVAPDAKGNDGFGTTALSGDLALVGAYSRDAVYVFARTGGTWTFQTKLTSPQGGDYFGAAIEISGNTAVIGAYGASDGGGAYVFTHEGGVWSQQARLGPGPNSRSLGATVAISGDTIALGSHVPQPSPILIFVREGTVWTQQAEIHPSDPIGSRFFPSSIALSGDTLIAGRAGGGGLYETNDAGAAFVFVRTGSSWTQQAKLVAADGQYAARFGHSVALDGDVALIGANKDSITPGSGEGSAYVFLRAGEVWTQQAKLRAADARAADQFGASVALDGPTAVVGAPFVAADDFVATGAAYVFGLDAGQWSQQAQVLPSDRDRTRRDFLGTVVAISGNIAAVGVPGDDVGRNRNQGSIYVFRRDPGAWTLESRILAGDGGSDDRLGQSLAISGETIVAGIRTPNRSGGGGYLPGRLLVFVRSGGAWTQQAALEAADGNVGLGAGQIALAGDTAIATSYFSLYPDRGIYVYVFRRQGTVWMEEAVITLPADAGGDGSIQAVSLSRNTLVAGTPPRIDLGLRGAVLVYQRTGRKWTLQAKLLPPNGTTDIGFGTAIAISEDSVVVGAPYEGVAAHENQGAAYVFRRTNSKWRRTARLSASDGVAGDFFGQSVAIAEAGSVTDIAIGAPGAPGMCLSCYPSGNSDRPGAAYLFRRSGTSWDEQRLSAKRGLTGDNFGLSVDLTLKYLIVGAPAADTGGGVDSGAAYAFSRPRN